MSYDYPRGPCPKCPNCLCDLEHQHEGVWYHPGGHDCPLEYTGLLKATWEWLRGRLR